MKVLFATPECAPLIKTGGLGDVSAALPPALRSAGIDVRVLLPGYPVVKQQLKNASVVAGVEGLASQAQASLLQAELPGGVPLYVLDCPALFERAGSPYGDQAGRDWPDNALRFGLFSQVAARIGGAESPLTWRADVVHSHDWPAALAAAYLRYSPAGRAASVMTIHNLAFHGSFDPSLLAQLQLPPESFSIEGLEFHGRLSFMKAGLYYADAITAVSEGYAREIRTEANGSGFHGLLESRREALHGITNGIDTAEWDPSRDRHLPSRYSSRSLPRKKRDKEALRERMQLEREADTPVLGLVSRLTDQKGIDLVLEAAEAMIALPAQIAVLGAGDRALEEALQALASANPGRVAVRIGYDEELAHLIEAGADVFLMPSRFEPCGMNQMYSQRYGTPPVAHATGGLADTVVDCNEQSLLMGTAGGFLFAPATAEALLGAVRRAIALYKDRKAWTALQKSAMGKDFGWEGAAAKYAALYKKVATATS